MLRNISGPVFIKLCFFLLLFLLVFQKSSSFCRENESFEKKKQKKQKRMDQFLTYKKGNLGPIFNFTAYIYISLSLSLSSVSLVCLLSKKDRGHAAVCNPC